MVNGIANNEPRIGNINNIPFKELKLKTGDLVLEINGKPINYFSDIFLTYNEINEDEDIFFLVKRNEDIIKFLVPNLFQPLIKSIEPLSPASKAGLLPGDFILKVNENNILSFNELKKIVNASNGASIRIRCV